MLDLPGKRLLFDVSRVGPWAMATIIRWMYDVGTPVRCPPTGPRHSVDVMSTTASAPVTATPSVSATSTAKGIASLVLGICSLFAGWTFFAPAIGLILGIVSLRGEPRARTQASWGIALNAIAMSIWVILTILALAFGWIAATSTAFGQ